MTDINTPDTTLLESQAVMRFDRNSGSEVQYLFDPEGAESESYPRAVQISTLAWLEMGRPESVVVSVRPGDVISTEHLRATGFLATLGRLVGGLVGAAVMLIICGAVAVGAIGLLVLLKLLLETLTGS